MGDSIASANGQGSSNMPGPVSATERASIIGMLAYGPESGSNVALDYIARTPGQGMSSDGPTRSMAQQYVDTYGGEAMRASSMTGVMPYGTSGRLTPDGPYVEIPGTGVPALPEVTVYAERDYDDGSYNASEAARLSNYPAPTSANSYPFPSIDFMTAARASVEADKTAALNELDARIARGPVLTPTTGLPVRQLTAGEIARANSFEMQAGRSTAQGLVAEAMISPSGLVASTSVAAFGATTNLQRGNYGAAAWNAAEIGMNFAGAGVLSKIGKPVAFGDSPETALSSLLRNGAVPESLGRTRLSGIAPEAVEVSKTGRALGTVEEIQFWNGADVVGNDKLGYRRVYQRDDLFDPHVIVDGISNLARMGKGRPPIGYDGQPVNLHHLTQNEPGALAEVGGGFHSENTRVLHGLTEAGSSFRYFSSGALTDAEKAFNRYKYWYWQQRAKGF